METLYGLAQPAAFYRPDAILVKVVKGYNNSLLFDRNSCVLDKCQLTLLVGKKTHLHMLLMLLFMFGFFKWAIFLQLLHIRPDPKTKLWGIVVAVHFTGQMPFQSPNQQC